MITVVLITTDLTLSEDDIIRIYGKRWAIEVFFKVCKSYLKLTKSFRVLELPQKARKLMDLPAQRLTDIMTIRNREKGKCH